MAQIVANPGVQTDRLRHRLADLRRRMWLTAVTRGICCILILLLGGVLLAALLDWRFHLPSVVRALFLVTTLGSTIGVAYRYLFVPLQAPADDLSLALLIEKQHSELNDSLASTVEFLQEPFDGDVHGSPELRRASVRRTLRRIERCDFDSVINSRGLYLSVVAMLGCVAAIVAICTQYPALAGTGLQRLAIPFGSTEWPLQTQLEIDTPRERIGQNEAYEVRGRVGGAIPAGVSVAFHLDGGAAIEHSCEVATDPDAESGTFVTVLKPGQAQREFRFQVRANDATTRWYGVVVLPPPQLEPLNGRASPQVHLEPPAYTDLPFIDLPDGGGDVDAIAGTLVTLRAGANRSLSRAWIRYEPEPRCLGLSAFLSPLGSVLDFAPISLFASGQTVWDDVPAELSADGRAILARFLPRVSGRYVLHIEDEAGLRNSRLFDLQVRADPAPLVNLERPSATRDHLSVLPTGEVPLRVLIEDREFAIRSAWLEYRVVSTSQVPGERTSPPSKLLLYDHRISGAARWGPLAPLLGTIRLRDKHVEIEQRLVLNRLPGVQFKDGCSLILQACADDFDDVAVNKQPGRSHEIEIQIVNRDALDVLLNHEQAKVQKELLDLREQQREALKKVADTQAHLKQAGKLDSDDHARLQQAERIQDQIREKVGTQDQAGLRRAVARILEALRNNQLPRSAVHERMGQVGSQLDRLAREELGPIQSLLNAARKQTENPEEKQRQAQALENQAAEQEKEAKQLEQLAAKKQPGDTSKSALQQQARSTRQQAQNALKQAKELREPGPKEIESKDQLSGARRHQEEVEKTLTDLLNRVLDPFASTGEVRSEAKTILQEQRRLLEQTEELNKQMLGGGPESLPVPERVKLDRVKEDQRRLEPRLNQLIDKMERVRQDREAKQDGETAREMSAALDAAQKGDIAGNIKKARDHVNANQLNDAARSQRESVKSLEDLVKQLEDRREAELDRLAKKLREVEKEMDQIAQEQERLRKKIKEAQAITDTQKREAELKRLAREQEQIKMKAEQMAEQLTRMRMTRSGQEMARAAAQMEQALRQLQRGQSAEEQQDDALDRLDEARRELDQTRREVEEELAREQLAKIADALKTLKEKQEERIKERADLERRVQQSSSWGRGHRATLKNEGYYNQELSKDASSLAKAKLEGAPVFARILEKASSSMREAGQQLVVHDESLVKRSELAVLNDQAKALQWQPQDATAFEQVAVLQREALHRLEQLLDTLNEQNTSGASASAGQTQEGSERPPGDAIPPLAQLKLLRALQTDVNRRTEDFQKRHPDAGKLSKDEQNELQSIRRDQQEVADLLEALNGPESIEGGRP